jgi:competence CoiA-like predicted nuclease
MNINQNVINNNRREYLDFLVRDNSIDLCNGEKNESMEHFLKKCEIAKKLTAMGHHVVCEGKLKNNVGRPDVLVLDVSPPIAYEIVHSETESSLKAKAEKYGDIRIVVVRI